MPDCLAIHYYYPPIRSAAVLRNYFISRELSRHFDNVHIITTSNRNLLQKEELKISDNISIYEATTLDYRSLSASTTKNNHFSESKKESPVAQSLIKLQKTLPFNLLIGEGSIFYLLMAYRQACKIVSANDIKLVYSSFGPYIDHMLAFLLKNRFPDLKWIADFRDLQIEPLYKNVYFEKLQRRFERKILANADLVVTISRGLKHHLEAYNRPILVIPRGIDLRPTTSKHFSKFTICYTGSLYRNFRDGDIFFSTLAAMISSKNVEREDVQIIYAGKDGQQFSQWIGEYKLGAIYKDLGYVSRKKALDVQNRSHLQLLLTSSTTEWEGVFTGKLFEYIESGNPVIVLIKGVYDKEIEAFIQDTGAGIVVYDPPREKCKLRSYIIDHYLLWKRSGQIEASLDRKYIKENLSWEAQVGKIISAIAL